MNELIQKVPDLPLKRKLFADAYLNGVPITKAYADAGYSARSANSNASRLMSDDGIKAYIAYREAETAERNKISQDEIIKTAREVVGRCMQAEPVLDKKGDQVYVNGPSGKLVAAYTFQGGVALKGAELLAKMGGYLREQGIDQEQRPAFVGITINMGNGKPSLVHGKGMGNSRCISKPNNHKKADIIDVI